MDYQYYHSMFVSYYELAKFLESHNIPKEDIIAIKEERNGMFNSIIMIYTLPN